MQVLIDADACPVTRLVIKICEEYKVSVSAYLDASHEYRSSYASVFICDKGHDSVDMIILSKVNKGDIVVTQDYGLASLVLAKKAYPINQNGFIYSEDNIDTLLMTRYIGAKIRKSGGRTKGPHKRTSEDDEKFEKTFRLLLNKNLVQN